MKTYPTCGKSLPDYAKRCKYCETDLPVYQPVSYSANQALTCPACGATLRYARLRY